MPGQRSATPATRLSEWQGRQDPLGPHTLGQEGSLRVPPGAAWRSTCTSSARSRRPLDAAPRVSRSPRRPGRQIVSSCSPWCPAWRTAPPRRAAPRTPRNWRSAGAATAACGPRAWTTRVPRRRRWRHGGSRVTRQPRGELEGGERPAPQHNQFPKVREPTSGESLRRP